METTRELQTEIEKIAMLNAKLAGLDRTTTFGRIEVTEIRSQIADCEEFIQRLSRRINGTPEPGQPTNEQLTDSDYALSDEYDN